MIFFFLIKIFWKPSHFGQMSCLNYREAGPWETFPMQASQLNGLKMGKSGHWMQA